MALVTLQTIFQDAFPAYEQRHALPAHVLQCPRIFYTDLDTLICKSLDTDFVLPLVWAVHFA